MQIRLKIREKLLLLKSDSRHRVSIINAGWLMSERIIRMCIEVFLSIWIARYLGIELFGAFNYALAFAAIFNTISTLGLDSIAVRYLVLKNEETQKVLGTVFWLKLIGGAFCSLFAIASIIATHHNEKQIVLLVAILSSSFIFQAFTSIDFLFQSRLESKFSVLAKNSAYLIVSLLKFVAITAKMSVIVFACANAIEVALISIGLIIAYKFNSYSFKAWRWDTKLAKELMKEGWPLILSGVSIIVYVKIDQLMLGELIGDKAVGIYSAAARISEVWYFIPIAVTTSVAPSIYAAKEISNFLYYKKIQKLMKFLVKISFIVALPISFLSSSIIHILYGASYVESGYILAIHVWSSLPVFIGLGASPWYTAERLNHLTLWRTLFGAISNILLNLYLIPKYEGIGAAVATLISYSMADVLFNFINLKTRKIFMIQLKSLMIWQ